MSDIRDDIKTYVRQRAAELAAQLAAVYPQVVASGDPELLAMTEELMASVAALQAMMDADEAAADIPRGFV